MWRGAGVAWAAKASAIGKWHGRGALFFMESGDFAGYVGVASLQLCLLTSAASSVIFWRKRGWLCLPLSNL
jgi:hypothetical protein